ncbi:histidinol-phosphate transaminase [Nocardioides insulae]|uniref:histidinol-phosphate transaminase n=1 Tax=Nocardioides insulae TaxID=394734 RepID=UPI0003FA734A|nr:histidinol-phosphate transaminase [Nocardioides insulae]
MTAPQPRPTVLNIPPYVAGKAPVERPGLVSYKLSSNENPYPPLPGVLEAAERAAATMNRYPDMGNARLFAALSETFDVPVEDLAVGTGSVGLLYGLIAAFCQPGEEVVYAWRSFEAYPIAVLAGGATSVQVPLLPDGRHDLAAMAAAVTERTRVVLLCTPNNPTGPALTQQEVDDFLAAVPPEVLVVIDEAYVEFVRLEGAVDGLATYRAHDNVLLTRTFSKAYGLAGFRVGYAVGPAPIAAALRAVALPFGVSAVAEAAAVASLAARDELLERVEALVAERTRVHAGLRELGWPVPDPQGNFVWFGFPGESAAIAAFATAAEERRLMVRPLGTDGLRVTIGEPEANDRLLALAGDLRAPSA